MRVSPPRGRWFPRLVAVALLFAGCATPPPRPPDAERRVPAASGATPAPEAGVPAPAPPPGERPAVVVPTPSEIAGTRFVRVLLTGGSAKVVLEGDTVRLWGADGRFEAESSGRVTLSAVGERIRWNETRLMGGSLDAAGVPDLSVAGRRVGGRVRVIARRGTLLAVAAVPLETYVAAVVSREAPPKFFPEALKAMAVAVRTYAAGMARTPRDPDYDMAASVEDQVFEGVDDIAPPFREAAEATRGEVALYRGEPARTVYHSTCGGRTESAANAWGKDAPYLRDQPCEDCSGSPAYRWEYRMSAKEGRRVAQSLGVRSGKDLWFSVTAWSPTGRASRVRITSTGVSREVSAAEFRKAVGYARLRSLKMEIETAADGWIFRGQGYGHGVGMCQYGANGMARAGMGYREILARYYPGVRIARESP
ncbi:MAG TPA: SpoIID/LytB domain-containing protein [Candidatus Deferrimicrobiaceae bacterium]